MKIIKWTEKKKLQKSVETDLMCVLCSEFSCRVGNNHQIQRKKREDELAQQTFLFLLFLGASSLLFGRILMPSMDKMTFTWSSSQFQLDIVHTEHILSCKAINFISFDPLQPTIPCQRKCSTIIFLTGCHFL